MHQLYTAVFEPGFFGSAQVHTAATIGGVVAIVSAITGVFTVIRGQSFAGHALGDVSAAGGSGALLIGLSPVAGFVGLGIIGAGAMDLIGVRRLRGRDLATGVVLGAAIGLSALFLYLTSATGATTGATQQILFGSIFTSTSGTIPAVTILGAIALTAIAVIGRGSHRSDHQLQCGIHLVERDGAARQRLAIGVSDLCRSPPWPPPRLTKLSEHSLPALYIRFGPTGSVQGTNGIDLDVQSRRISAPHLRDDLVQAIVLPLRRQDIGAEPVPGPPRMLRLSQRGKELMRPNEDELHVQALVPRELLPLRHLVGPAGLGRHPLRDVRIARRKVHRERDEVALQAQLAVQDATHGLGDLRGRRRVELEKVLSLPCPHITVRQHSPALAPAIWVAEAIETNAIRPLDDILLDQDRRQLLKPAGTRRGLPGRADTSEVNVRKGDLDTSRTAHPIWVAVALLAIYVQRRHGVCVLLTSHFRGRTVKTVGLCRPYCCTLLLYTTKTIRTNYRKNPLTWWSYGDSNPGLLACHTGSAHRWTALDIAPRAVQRSRPWLDVVRRGPASGVAGSQLDSQKSR